MASIRGGLKAAQLFLKYGRILINTPDVKVGFIEGSTYPDGTPLPLVAAVMEFGSSSKGIPPRPFIRNMIAKNKAGWGPALAKQLRDTKFDVDLSLDRMGQGIKGQLQQSIHDTNTPPLAPATVRAKGFDKPLIDTGFMLNHVEYKVFKK